MQWLRRLSFAFLLALGLSPAFAQAPPAVPGLPDAPRLTSYSLTASNCGCAVNFAIYGDNTDYQSWIEVYLNGVLVNYNDPVFGWALTSATGPLATIPRPINDAILTFANVQTGTVQIVGARRPRRVSQFQENRGVAARDLNQVLTDVVAMLREDWDKINDVTGRAIVSQPGNVVGPLPLPAACQNAILGFDATGLNPVCDPPSSALPVAIDNTLQFVGSLLGVKPYTAPGGVARTQASKNSDTISIVDYGGDPTGVASSDAALTGAFSHLATNPSGKIYFPHGTYKFTSAKSLTFLSAVAGLSLEGDGSEASILTWPNASGGLVINYAGPMNSVHIHDLSFTTGQAAGGIGLSLVQGGACLETFASSDVSNVTFRGADNVGNLGSDYWTIGLLVNGVSGVNMDPITIYGIGAGASALGGGLTTKASGVAGCNAIYENVSKSIFNNLAVGIDYDTFSQGLTVTQSNFQNGQVGIVVPPGATNVAELIVVGNQFAQTDGSQIFIQAVIADAMIANNDFYTATGFASIDWTANTDGLSIVGNDFTGISTTGTYGVALTAGTTANTNSQITGNGFHFLGTGILLSASTGGANVQGNTFGGNSTNVSDGGATNVVANNVGFNPVGVTAAITVGASPATICAGDAPETDYFTQSATFGATVKLGSGSGPLVGTMSAATVEVVTNLGPHECEVVTWATTAPVYQRSIH